MEQTGTSLKTQVVIVGAGPTGLSLAVQLFRYGIDFIIIDKKNGTTTLSKALVVQARSLEIFQELGLAEKAISTGKMTTALRVFYKGKTRAAVDLKGLGTGLSPYPFALSLEQSKTEKLLADHLIANGKKINWNTDIGPCEQTANGVTVHCKTENGLEQRLEADYLVGCDGAGSQVRHQLGLSFEGSTEPKLFYVADVILKSPVINKNVLYMYMIRKGFVLFFPMEGTDHYRIVGILPDVKDMEQQFQFSDIGPLIKENIVTPIEFEKLSWFSTYKVHSRKAEAFMKDRCFIAGDAAHIHTPAGGQGMNTGIQDAYNLAWKLAYVLRKEANPELLKTYDTERSANAMNLLKTTDRMFDIMSGVNRFWNFMRLHFFSRLLKWVTTSEWVRKRIFPLISQTGIAYPDSNLTVKSSIGKLKAGDRMHYFVFSDGKEIFSYLANPVFKLLYFGDENAATDQDFGNIKLTRHNFREIPETLFGKEKNFYILLRPDNHISYIGRDIGQCRELFNRIGIS